MCLETQFQVPSWVTGCSTQRDQLHWIPLQINEIEILNEKGEGSKKQKRYTHFL